jgi:hypothetical protein
MSLRIEFGDVLAFLAGAVVMMHGVLNRFWPQLADAVSPPAILIVLALAWFGLAAQVRVVRRLSVAIGQKQLVPPGILEACLRLGAAPVLWVLAALLVLGALFGWHTTLIRQVILASIFAAAAILLGPIQFWLLKALGGDQRTAE